MNAIITGQKNPNIMLISDMIINYLDSDDFIIATPNIFLLEEEILFWIKSGDCGGMVVGRTRIGKSSAQKYVSMEMKKLYGDGFPVIIWELSEHTATDKSFYKAMIGLLGISNQIKGYPTTQDLRERCIRYMGMMGEQTPFKKILFFIDEAHKLAICELDWLMDLYNALRMRYGVFLTVVLVGTKEIIEYKKALIANEQHQIVERFMLNVFDFHGLEDANGIMLCLSELDKTEIYVSGSDKTVKLAEFYFPEAYKNGEGFFAKYANIYWTAFQEINAEFGKNEKVGIPMEYLMKSFKKYLIRYGVCSIRPDYFLTKEHIKQAILLTHYHETSDSASEYDFAS